eukprot:6916991-Prymnesium_polylepis.1
MSRTYVIRAVHPPRTSLVCQFVRLRVKQLYTRSSAHGTTTPPDDTRHPLGVSACLMHMPDALGRTARRISGPTP